LCNDPSAVREKSMNPFKIVGLGEVLWDIFPDGARFGGAPANFACDAAQLGADAYLVSQIGVDDLGTRALVELAERGVRTDFVAKTDRLPTGTVDVELDVEGKPRFVIHENVAWDELSWSDTLADLAARADAVCFGTLGQRCPAARGTIQRFLHATRSACLRVFDINLRQRYFDRDTVIESLNIASALKLNDDELPILLSLVGQGAPDDHASLRRLAERFGLSVVALTRGAAGAKLFVKGEIVDIAAPRIGVRDTVGAGDAFTAALVIGYLRGDSLRTIAERAVAVAGFVCTQAGATPILPKSLPHER
jgi:fructokinase